MILISSTKAFFSNKMLKNYLIPLFLAFPLILMINRAYPSEGLEGNRIFGVVQKMASAFKGMEDYSCEVEQAFFQNGMEDQRYRFKFYYKKRKKIRVDFSYPYSGLTLIYIDGEKEATVVPFRFMPGLKFRFSVDNPIIKTPAGQRIDQTDMGHFIDFLSKNLKGVKQGEDEFQEDEKQVRFLFWALDYIEEKSHEKYWISISKNHWLPVRIERYNLEGSPLEATRIGNYTINSGLEEKLFAP